ncbi:MAG: hypothetical protein HYS13_13005 [Planctomycetia bacterium]|nr:hypothetical protein [Planctomycetia bacterium]
MSRNRFKVLNPRFNLYRPVPDARRALTHRAPLSQRWRGEQIDERLPFTPPENWHEPTGEGDGYRVIVQPPGKGFQHVVSEADVRSRLAELPEDLTHPLEVVQFSRQTRKKSCFPCYGMQWGPSIYLYPMEVDLVENYSRPPKPSQYNEARMYGGRWEQAGERWRLIWTPEAIKDFYLNNILIHELGHLLDDRNTNSAERERFAEWFAIRYGYAPTLGQRQGRLQRKIVRRHAK